MLRPAGPVPSRRPVGGAASVRCSCSGAPPRGRPRLHEGDLDPGRRRGPGPGAGPHLGDGAAVARRVRQGQPLHAHGPGQLRRRRRLPHPGQGCAARPGWRGEAGVGRVEPTPDGGLRLVDWPALQDAGPGAALRRRPGVGRPGAARRWPPVGAGGRRAGTGRRRGGGDGDGMVPRVVSGNAGRRRRRGRGAARRR